MLPSKYLEKGWCQFVSAVDENDIPIAPNDRSAIKWCLFGSVHAAHYSGSISTTDKDNILSELACILDIELIEDISGYNDAPERTQEEVIKTMKQAEIKLDLIDSFLE